MDQAISEFLSGYFSTNQRKRKTETAYRIDLTQFMTFVGRNVPITSVRSNTIEEWAATLRTKGYSPSSTRRKIAALRILCSYWLRKGIMNESPFWRVKLSYGRIEQLPRSLTQREIQALLLKARGSYLELTRKCDWDDVREKPSSNIYRYTRNLAILELMFATGMRVGELSTLDITDFQVEESAFRIQGKGGIDRLAFVVDELSKSTLKKYLEMRRSVRTSNLALFLNSSGSRISTQGIANLISKLGREANLDRHITPHMLRHTVATLLLRNGVDIRVVQEFLGHASIATTQRYTHVSKEHLIGVLRERHPSLGFRSQMRLALQTE